jgi:glycosyltransferase involved in cell wall biosynthesis
MMENNDISKRFKQVSPHQDLYNLLNEVPVKSNKINRNLNILSDQKKKLAEILVITSYPPRVCGIASYSQDLVKSLNLKFNKSFSIKICALNSGKADYNYPEEVRYILNTSAPSEYSKLAAVINAEEHIKIVFIQHEFGFFQWQEQSFLKFLFALTKPVVITFHTVLPHPNELLRLKVRSIVASCQSIVVMTQTSANILMSEYGISEHKIAVIAHGTHLVPYHDEALLKLKNGLTGKKVLSTFGLLSSGKSIETTLDALPAIIEVCPEVVFLIIGKTHPEVIKNDSEKYRESLELKVVQNSLQNHVIFINNYVPLSELLEYLQLTDIYLFTTNDPNQAVSGTFAYAMSCACPIISTPIPHAKEVLTEDTGIIIDFKNSNQLAHAVIKLIKDEPLRKKISSNTLQKIISSAWENSAVEHARLFESTDPINIKLQYNRPKINLNHIRLMTTSKAMIQFSKGNQPDLSSGYTLDDNARALVGMCMFYKLEHSADTLASINKYFNFIKFCQQPEGNFLNYVDKFSSFTIQNSKTNLDDSNGRAIWALGYLFSNIEVLPERILNEAEKIIQNALPHLMEIHSPRSMAFIIKGLYFFNRSKKSVEVDNLIILLANRLVQMYKHVSNRDWNWFEDYLTYANSVLPEAMVYAWMQSGDSIYKEIALSSFDFLLEHTFNENGIEVISNKTWLQKGAMAEPYGEQPIDVAYTLMTLSTFYDAFNIPMYRRKMEIAFSWFLGKNRLHQIVYNPCTGGCYDGLEKAQVNMNQGAESTLSYLMARLTMENYQPF